jgi:mannosyltransferase
LEDETGRELNPLAGLVLAAGWAAIPVLVSFFASYITPMFVARYLIVALPGFAILAARGMSALRPVWLAVVPLALVVALSVPGLQDYYFDYEKENWRGATRFVVQNAEPGDGVIVYAGRLRKVFDYYIDLFEPASLPDPIYPKQDWGDYESGGLDKVKEEDLAAAAGTYDRVWLVLSHAGAGAKSAATSQLIHRLLLKEHQEAAYHVFNGIEVKLFATP